MVKQESIIGDCYIVEVLLFFCIAFFSELEWSLHEEGWGWHACKV